MSWIENTKQDVQSVYILGDLFDYWFSGLEESLQDVIGTLRDPRIHILPGNRDFLITSLQESGIHVMREEEVITSPSSERLLLAHGHTLTQGDCGFKVLHALGWPVLRFFDRRLPGTLKDDLARLLVASSAAVRPPYAVIDPDIAGRRRVDAVVCGHLHRKLVTKGLIVLPSFFDTGEWLLWDERGPRIMPGK
jgi:UDP-2,3-diacylglucosamine hydrolase